MSTGTTALSRERADFRSELRTSTDVSCNCLPSNEEGVLAGLAPLSSAASAVSGEPCPPRCWFVMRDLTRSNAKRPAYVLLGEQSVEVFTPMVRRTLLRNGRKTWVEVPFLHDLLFVHASRAEMDPIVEHTPTLQYRYVRGGWQEAMTVPAEEMERFIHAVRSTSSPRFYRPEEITPEMYGKRVRIVGGALDGYEGHLQSMRGSKVKRLLVELPNYLTASVEVQPDLIEVLK